ncbi:polysaccharide deacetylase family protein [Sinomicrobium sp.]
MLRVYTNSDCLEEKQYIFRQILGNISGVEYELYIDEDLSEIVVKYKEEKKSLSINSSFFNQFKSLQWLSKESLPKQPLKYLKKDTFSLLNLDVEEELPVIYGSTEYDFSPENIKLGVDIFGSCFFMLSRYEELVIEEKDIHGRFPAKQSLAYKEGFLMRPVVDEYTELLWGAINFLWPDCRRKRRSGKTLVSCDVDYLKDSGAYFPGIVKRMAGDLLVRKSLKEVLKSIRSFYQVAVLKKKYDDPFYSFDLMMDVCEEQNLKMAFYFIPKNNKKSIDGDYDIDSDEVIKLMQKIMKRGHEIGYHASYDSYKEIEKTIAEVTLLKKVYEKAGGNADDITGGRQHYLRWETGVTEKNWEAAGLTYDSTLGYAEHIGFRCGTSHEYNFYDCVNRKPMKLKIRPLLIMDCSLIDKKYMGLDFDTAMNQAALLRRKSFVNRGNFTLLWHNSFLRESFKKKMFRNILEKFD